MRLAINPLHPEPRKIRHAVEALRRGDVIAYPTDTVYGLGCTLDDRKAAERLYQVKQLDRTQPLAFLCPDLSDIARYAVVENDVYRILRRALPGPYCFVLPATREVPRLLMQKRKTIGLRIPDHAVVQALLRELGCPILSSSASVDGDILNDPDEIDDRFRGLSLVLDAGIGGLEPSTVIDLSGPEPVVLRHGVGDVDAVL